MEPEHRAGIPHQPERHIAEDDAELVRNPQQLLPGVDYLYCATCGQHVPAIRLQQGVWELQCSRCAGECGLCGCDKTRVCTGPSGTPVPTHMYVVRPRKSQE